MSRFSLKGAKRGDRGEGQLPLSGRNEGGWAYEKKQGKGTERVVVRG